MSTLITWTPEKLARLKAAYQQHQADPHGVFTFDGHEFVVSYAKYLIQYLEGVFSGKIQPTPTAHQPN